MVAPRVRFDPDRERALDDRDCARLLEDGRDCERLLEEDRGRERPVDDDLRPFDEDFADDLLRFDEPLRDDFTFASSIAPRHSPDSSCRSSANALKSRTRWD